MAALSAAAVSCNSDDSGGSVTISPEKTVQALANGTAVEYTVRADEDAVAPFVIEVESLDEGRAVAAFEDGSKTQTYNPATADSLIVDVTCKDDNGAESDKVAILFTVQSTIDGTDAEAEIREIICPGHDQTVPDGSDSGGEDGGNDNPPDPDTGGDAVQKSAITVSPLEGLVTTEDGGTATFSVALTKKPSADVTIPAVSLDTSEGVVTPASVTFAPDNWNIPQTFTVTGQDDALSDGDMTYVISLGPSKSQDPAFNNIALPSLSAVNKDNEKYTDPAGLSISPKELTVYEGGSAVIGASLETEPSAQVTISFKLSDTSRATVEPSVLTFKPTNYGTSQSVKITALRNGIPGDDADITIQAQIASTDPRFSGLTTAPLPVHIADTEGGAGETLAFRAMAANITTGKNQSYDPGHGIRIFKAVKPDIVMIQEFRYGRNNDDDIDSMVQSTFGADYSYHRGRYIDNSWIPNGIISRFPIIDSGYWKSNMANNRDWDWAVVDLPGSKELLVVSLHLHTDDNAKEIPVLTKNIESKISADAAKGLNYYVMVGGDFNSATVLNGKTDLKRILTTSMGSNERPEDQYGDSTTNATRGKTLDVLLVDKTLHQKEIPAVIGNHSYPNGHVFDSRVYSKLGELSSVAPVQANDSDGGSAVMNQHMAVIRDFEIVAQ